jgi:hypothetical protein
MQHPRPNSRTSEHAHFGEDRVNPHPLMDRVTDETRTEIAVLRQNGVDIQIVPVDLANHYRLDDDKQKLVDHAIETYSEVPEFASKLVEANPAVAGWLGMAKSMSPLALTFFYNTGDMERPSDGLSEEAILHTKLSVLGGKTATEIVKETKKEGPAKLILDRTNAFFEAGSLKKGVDAFGLTAHDIMAGSLDRIGDITRAKEMIALAQSHVERNADRYASKGIVVASFASGLGEPMYWLLDQLRSQGVQIDVAHQVDMDPIALAANAYMAAKYGMQDKIAMHPQNLLLTPADSYIEPHRVDFLEAVGVVEYLKKPLAIRLLKNAASVVRPGGMIVFGNMLKSRPQQKWFEGLWPKLEQRSITEVLELIEEAGFSRDWVEVRLSEDGLYAMYAIKIPEEASLQQKETASDVARRVGRAASPASL